MWGRMAPVLFRWPATGMQVQGWCADDATASGARDVYIGIQCLACDQVHLVNPETGRVLGRRVSE